jgi:hypothetical protein
MKSKKIKKTKIVEVNDYEYQITLSDYEYSQLKELIYVASHKGNVRCYLRKYYDIMDKLNNTL